MCTVLYLCKTIFQNCEYLCLLHQQLSEALCYKFIYEGRQVKVKVAGLKKVSNRYTRNGCLRVRTNPLGLSHVLVGCGMSEGLLHHVCPAFRQSTVCPLTQLLYQVFPDSIIFPFSLLQCTAIVAVSICTCNFYFLNSLIN